MLLVVVVVVMLMLLALLLPLLSTAPGLFLLQTDNDPFAKATRTSMGRSKTEKRVDVYLTVFKLLARRCVRAYCGCFARLASCACGAWRAPRACRLAAVGLLCFVVSRATALPAVAFGDPSASNPAKRILVTLLLAGALAVAAGCWCWCWCWCWCCCAAGAAAPLAVTLPSLLLLALLLVLFAGGWC